MQFNKKTVFIALFAVLYLAVGLVSTIHAVSFFGLANSPILGVILAITFEIGQAAVLFNLLTSPSQRKRFMPWALMCILTLVQILGNIFSSYKYLITNSTEDLRYFKEPIFVWTELPDQQCNVIITYIVGAILPIVALCLTEMVVSYLGNEDAPKDNIQQTNQSEVKSEKHDEAEEKSEEKDESQLITTEDVIRTNNKLVKDFEEKNEVIETNDIQEEIVETIPEQETQNIEQEPSQTDLHDDLSEQEPIIEQTPIVIDKPEPVITQDTKQAVDELLTGNIKQTNVKPVKSSHFINL